MKVVAFVVNVNALVLAVVMRVLGRPSGATWLWVAFWTAVPIVNLIYILGCPSEASWLGSYFNRKKRCVESLEEEIDKAVVNKVDEE